MDLEKEARKEAAAIIRKDEAFDLTLSPAVGLALLSTITLAMNHPMYPRELKFHMRRFANTLINAIAIEGGALARYYGEALENCRDLAERPAPIKELP